MSITPKRRPDLPACWQVLITASERRQSGTLKESSVPLDTFRMFALLA